MNVQVKKNVLQKYLIQVFIPECPYVHFKHVDFQVFQHQIFMHYNYPIDLIFGIRIPRKTMYNVIFSSDTRQTEGHFKL